MSSPRRRGTNFYYLLWGIPMLAVNRLLTRSMQSNFVTTRNISFFKNLLKKEETPYDKLIAKCNRKNTANYGYKLSSFSQGDEWYSYIDLLHTKDIDQCNVAMALLVNAVKNNSSTEALDNILLSMKSLGTLDNYRGMRSFADIPNTIFNTIINKLRNEERLNIVETLVYNEVLPAYRVTHFYPATPGNLLLAKPFITTPSGLMVPICEQFIEEEYNALHAAPGLKNAKDCIEDLIAKQTLHKELWSGFRFRITGNQCLMSLEEYKRYLEDNHPCPGNMLIG